MYTIEVQSLTVDYGNSKGIFDVSFQVRQGQVLGFLGPNGAGKTTTMRQLMGFARPNSGCCKILGMGCFTHAAEIQRHVGYLPGEIAFMDTMTGAAFIRFIAGMKGMKDLTRAEELADFFELDARGPLRKMSKGMKQKIGIVCAFMQDADILLLDEPTSGLDPLMQNRFVELIHAEKAKGKTILMSSHMFDEIERTCDRAIIIKQGRLVANDSIEALSEQRQKQLTISFETAAMAQSFAARQPGAQLVNGRRVRVTLSGDMTALVRLLAEYNVSNLQPAQQNLESIFMQYYGGGTHHA